MNDDEAWSAIDAQRVRTADLLETLNYMIREAVGRRPHYPPIG